QQGFGPEQEISVLITSEGGRIPVNSLTDERWRVALVELFVLWGMDAATASIATESLADWIDGDSEMLSNGAENAYYSSLDRPEFPANQPFTSLEQMLFVQGMDEVARFQPMWRDYFTIHGDGLLDLNAAVWEAIMAVTGTTQDSALNFVAVRNGDDGIRGTIDDYQFTDMGEVQALLGLSENEYAEIADLISLDSTVIRIESEGRYGDFKETRVLLATEAGNGWSPLARFRK
ncbi:MAG: general secretion pathway protein GspK, partial [Verrucomicrobiales bacterium]|nr:general secretion pathway protein GspK [Verrucomicrobiales bacterium]